MLANGARRISYSAAASACKTDVIICGAAISTCEKRPDISAAGRQPVRERLTWSAAARPSAPARRSQAYQPRFRDQCMQHRRGQPREAVSTCDKEPDGSATLYRLVHARQAWLVAARMSATDCAARGVGTNIAIQGGQKGDAMHTGRLGQVAHRRLLDVTLNQTRCESYFHVLTQRRLALWWQGRLLF